MRVATQTAPTSGAMLWAGRIMSGLVVLFMIFDGVTKVLQVAPVLEALAQLDVPAGLTVGIGILVLACTVVYVIPATSVLGAILLTGFLGGAVAIQLRAGAPPFNTAFPIIFGALTWGGIYLRNAQLRALLPLIGRP
jgi:hypothetical protein